MWRGAKSCKTLGSKIRKEHASYMCLLLLCLLHSLKGVDTDKIIYLLLYSATSFLHLFFFFFVYIVKLLLSVEGRLTGGGRVILCRGFAHVAYSFLGIAWMRIDLGDGAWAEWIWIGRKGVRSNSCNYEAAPDVLMYISCAFHFFFPYRKKILTYLLCKILRLSGFAIYVN